MKNLRFFGTKIKAFTLAEVLITLGIIGIISALAIPQLIYNYRKHVAETSLAKAVATFTQALKLSEQNNGSISALNTSMSQEDFIKQYIKPYMKVSETCNPITKCGYNSLYPWRQLNGGGAIYSTPNHGGRVPFLGVDGVIYSVSFFASDSGSINGDNNNVIIIDINGAKMPNKFGKDVFFLYRREDVDEISTYGYDKSDDEIRQNCSSSGFGTYCSTWIQRNGWKIPKDYPW